LFQDQKVFDVVVWGTPEIRDNLNNVQNLMIDTESGGQVPLGEVATVRVAPENSIIRRQGVSRRLDIEAEVSGRPLGAVTQEVARRIKDIPLPFEYHAQVLGEHIERQHALSSLYSYLIAAAVISYLLLQAVLGSWRLASLSLIGIPVAVLGSLVADTLSGGAFTLGGLLGVIPVVALTVRNGIMQVTHFQQLAQQENIPVGRAITQGMEERFAALITSAFTLFLVAVPFVVMGSVAGMEIIHPAAVSMLGGVITSLLVSLFVIPALCARFGIKTAADPLDVRPEPAELADVHA
jgi:Cu/Ag efflux pump CusA